MKPILLAALAAGLLPAGAAAQGIRCSAFLHNRDGSWTSFFQGDIMGERGPISVGVGERFSRGQRNAKSEVARALDALCTDDAGRVQGVR